MGLFLDEKSFDEAVERMRRNTGFPAYDIHDPWIWKIWAKDARRKARNKRKARERKAK